MLYNEDCLEQLALMDDNLVDLSFTSPPYNRKRNDKYTHFNDINDNWLEFNIQVIEQLYRVTKNHVIYNLQANYYNRTDVYHIIGHFSNWIRDIHIWQKSNPMPASGNSITNAVEYFLILGDKPLKSNTTYTKNILTTAVNSNMPKEHKAVMHPAVADHFIKHFTNEGDLVLDPFMGVGTTGVSCKKYNRSFIGIEKSEVYFNMSKQALESGNI